MSNHIVIAGTGRAGTSFLVQYLAACGLETHLTKHPDSKLDENANAGLEDLPTRGQTLPYVVKFPWLYEIVEELVERTDIQIDAVVMPIRDIVEAATSRAIVEMHARYGNEYLDSDVTHWETWATTPGGVIYSLNPIDQARILALGFHETIRKLVQKEVPIIFLDFPRLVADTDYLWSKLERFLIDRIDREEANAAHAKLADKNKVRAGYETSKTAKQQDVQSPTTLPKKWQITYPSHDVLDRAALLRELDHLRKGMTSLRAEANRQASETRRAHQEELRELEVRLSGEYESECQARLAKYQTELDARIVTLEHTIAAITGSRSWRITEPFRAIARWARRQR